MGDFGYRELSSAERVRVEELGREISALELERDELLGRRALAMGRVIDVLSAAAPAELSGREVVTAAATSARGLPGFRAQLVRQALDDLVAEGRCEERPGPRRSRLFRIPPS